MPQPPHEAPPGEQWLEATPLMRTDVSSLIQRGADTGAHPTLEALHALATPVQHPSPPLWLTGGEPTLRPDLPELIALLAGRPIGLQTDGLALVRPSALQPLHTAGLDRLRIWLHAGRPDAHDWLVGRPGAARAAMRAIRTARAMGLHVEVVALATRPTVDHLPELVEAAARLGAGELEIRLLVPDMVAKNHVVMLCPRPESLETPLEKTASAARRAGVTLRLRGLPRHLCGSAVSQLVAADHAVCLGPTGAQPAVLPGFVGPGRSDGAAGPFAAVDGALKPIPRGTRSPGLSRSSVLETARTGLLSAPTDAPPSTVRMVILAAEPTRTVRRRMLQAAQVGAHTLRLTGEVMAHPEAGVLLREATRLSFKEVAVSGLADGLDQLSDTALYTLRALSRVSAAIYGHDAESHDHALGRLGSWDATVRGLERLSRLTRVPTHRYVIVAPGTDLQALQAVLPTDFCGVRLAAVGGRIEALIRRTDQLADGPLRDALRSALPCCATSQNGTPHTHAGALFADRLLPDDSKAATPHPTDRRGAFWPCAAVVTSSDHACAGLAVGWTRAPQPALPLPQN